MSKIIITIIVKESSNVKQFSMFCDLFCNLTKKHKNVYSIKNFLKIYIWKLLFLQTLYIDNSFYPLIYYHLHNYIHILLITCG